MELSMINDMKNDQKILANDIELNKMNENMNELSGQLEEYLKNNDVIKEKSEGLKRPIDIDITTEKNEFGDTTILGKITIEKSAVKDLEKMQDKLENVRDKSASLIQKGLLKVYDGVKDTFISNVAEKMLDVGGKIIKKGNTFLSNTVKKIATKIVK